MLHMHMAQINKEPIQEVDEQELEAFATLVEKRKQV